MAALGTDLPLLLYYSHNKIIVRVTLDKILLQLYKKVLHPLIYELGFILDCSEAK